LTWRARKEEAENMATNEELLDALRDRLLEEVERKPISDAGIVLLLAEAYAWVAAPDQGHGQSGRPMI
jgi:hypothetical protein